MSDAVNTPGGGVDLADRRLTHLLHQAMRFDPHADQPVYIGWAEPGTAESAAGWKIARLTYDGLSRVTKVEWASGTATAYAFVWDDRATLTYS